ncbi:MAG: DUF2617 family protein [Planctomycetaceae bacterium]|nr:MAG: DUF2617 family protein [Planctomycetaceae bacterium]
MPVHLARPDVGTLVFRLFGRPVHPELVSVCARNSIRHAKWQGDLAICHAGHMITFHHRQGMLCEIATNNETPLPKGCQVISRRLRGCRNESVEHDAGILYHVSYQVEHLEPEVFLNLHEELMIDSARAYVAHQFPSSSRLAPCALSLIQTEVRSNSLLVHAFHTFPDNCAVVKTQSLFEI